MYSESLNLSSHAPNVSSLEVVGEGNVLHFTRFMYPDRFRLWGVDVMELPVTSSGNKHILVFQDYSLSSPWCIGLWIFWIMPVFGVPECLLQSKN